MVTRFVGGSSGAIRVLALLLTHSGRAWFRDRAGVVEEWWLTGHPPVPGAAPGLKDVELFRKFRVDAEWDRVYNEVDQQVNSWLRQVDELLALVQSRAARRGARAGALPANALVDEGAVPADLQKALADMDEESPGEEDWEPDAIEPGEPEAVADLAVAEALDTHNLYVMATGELAALVLAYARHPGARKYPVDAVVDGFRRWLYESLPASIRVTSYRGMWQDVDEFQPMLRPLPFFARRVLAIPASEAHSERAIGRLRSIFGDFRFALGNESVRAQLQMATLNAAARSE
jgi:hypothetical protein